jgi:hypothetical protein
MGEVYNLGVLYNARTVYEMPFVHWAIWITDDMV